MKKTGFLLVSLLFVKCCFTQDSLVNKIRFSSVNQVGVVAGAQRDAPIIQTINGIKYKGWSVGLGIGIDVYSERSVPVFLDVRKSFGKKDNLPFVYVDGGLNFSWLNFIDRENNSFPNYRQPCWYYDAGIGWKIPLGNKTGFLMSAGYSLKQLKGDRVAYGPIIGGQTNEYKEEFENIYRRIVLKLGVEL